MDDNLTAVLTRLTPEQIVEQAGELFTRKFAGAAMDNRLSEKDWNGIRRSFIGGYCTGWADSQTGLLEALLVAGYRLTKVDA